MLFALVEHIDGPKVSAVSRLKNMFAKNRGIEVFAEDIFGMRMLRARVTFHAGIGEKTKRRRVEALRDVMGANGIRRICFKKDFEFKSLFYERDFVEMDASDLLRKLAPDIIASATGGDGAVAVFFDSLTHESKKDVLALCRSFRQVLLVSRMAGEYADALVKEHGVPAVSNPDPSAIEKVDAALILGPSREPVKLKKDCAVFIPPGVEVENIAGGKKISMVELSYPEEIYCEIPQGYPVATIVSEAIEEKTLNIDVLTVVSVKTEDLTETNI